MNVYEGISRHRIELNFTFTRRVTGCASSAKVIGLKAANGPLVGGKRRLGKARMSASRYLQKQSRAAARGPTGHRPLRSIFSAASPRYLCVLEDG